MGNDLHVMLNIAWYTDPRKDTQLALGAVKEKMRFYTRADVTTDGVIAAGALNELRSSI